MLSVSYDIKGAVVVVRQCEVLGLWVFVMSVCVPVPRVGQCGNIWWASHSLSQPEKMLVIGWIFICYLYSLFVPFFLQPAIIVWFRMEVMVWRLKGWKFLRLWCVMKVVCIAVYELVISQGFRFSLFCSLNYVGIKGITCLLFVFSSLMRIYKGILLYYT